jgi:hypothetical protein
MKPIIWSGQINVSSGGAPQHPLGDGRPKSDLPIADKVAFVVLAAGLIALGGVLFTVGLAILLAVVAGGLLVGGIALARYRLFGQPAPRLRPGEIPADAVVVTPVTAALPAQATQTRSARAPVADRLADRESDRGSDRGSDRVSRAD